MRQALLLIVLFGAGCASAGPNPLPPPSGPPGPALALAPIAVRYVPSLDRPALERVEPGQRAICLDCREELDVLREPRESCEECGGSTFQQAFLPPFKPRLDTARLSARVAQALRDRGSFASVTELSGPAESWEEQERAAGATHRLELAVGNVELVYVDSNGWFVPKVIIFVASAILIFPGVDPPNWFLPGEDFAIRASGRWTLQKLGGSSPPKRGRWERQLVRDSFAAFGLGGIPSRPFFVAGFLRVPGCLDEDDWADIGAELKSPADQGLLNALIHASEERRNEKEGTSPR